MIWIIEKNKLSKARLIITNKSKFQELLKKLNSVEVYSKYWNGLINSYSKVTSKTINLLNDNTNSEEDSFELYNLFSTKEVVDLDDEQYQDKQKIYQLNELRKLKEFSQTLKNIIEEMWPGFGHFATEGINCTNLIAYETFDLDNCNGFVSDNKVLSDQIINNAKENMQVLSLAKKISKLCNQDQPNS